VEAAEWFRKAAAQGHEEAKNYLSKAETAEKERREREERERQNELRKLKRQMTFINVSVLVCFIVGLVFLALGLFLGEGLLLGAIISLLLGFAVPAYWPVLKQTWKIARGIPSFILSLIASIDEGCLVNVIGGLIFLFCYPWIATFGVPIHIVVTIVKYFSIRKKIKKYTEEVELHINNEAEAKAAGKKGTQSSFVLSAESSV
jgi:cation transport ATPase